MALSRNQSVFGIHSIAAYNPDTFVPFGIAKVVGAMTFSLSGETVPLLGGSNLFPWEVENGPIDSSGTFTFKELPDWLYQAFLGNAATTVAAEVNGNTSTIVNLSGTSAVSATVGIDSVGVESGNEADVKTAIYMVSVITATTVDVFALTDVDFSRGTDLIFQNDGLKITASALTIPGTSGTVSIPNTGLEFTGGSGSIAMTVGDTAWFDSRAQNTGATTATIGLTNSSFVDVGLVVAAQRKGNQEIFLLDIVRAKALGTPFPFVEKGWMESEINFTAFYDTTRDAVFRTIRVDGT